MSNIPSRSWRASKNWFFLLTIFLARGIFLIHHIWKKIKKGPEQKKFCIQKSFRSGPLALERNFLNMYCIFKLFGKSFKQLALFQFWELMSKNEISRTKSYIYFMKIWVASWFPETGPSLIHTIRAHAQEVWDELDKD